MMYCPFPVIQSMASSMIKQAVSCHDINDNSVKCQRGCTNELCRNEHVFFVR